MRRIISLGLIVVFSFLMMDFSSFTPIYFLLFLPGFLFGISVIIPRLFPDVFKNFKRLLRTLIYYILLWCFSIIVMSSLQILTNSINDKTPYLIVGTLTGMAMSFLVDFQFGFENKKVAYISITVLSILSCLIFDYYYPNPGDKELYTGIQIFIWNTMVGLGLTLNKTVNKTL
ncbi:hypothetical protein [Flavobacterium pectinovorum]|uniref:Uncharacterized protein n=1 Tax=Flavobacterium pectinovorum TaxID=29533 RepID=A0A502E4J9_9FLAO|nr:hypothetical protein [Flavobacterium pectinovorum]TPG31360.1 hypothetical protein EAH81_26910 [Flavobacterium pectinovorum]